MAEATRFRHFNGMCRAAEAGFCFRRTGVKRPVKLLGQTFQKASTKGFKYLPFLADRVEVCCPYALFELPAVSLAFLRRFRGNSMRLLLSLF
jgi:hypothetical protein